MTTHVGNEGEVYVGANQVAEVVGFSVSERVNLPDDSALGDDSDTHLVGSKMWDASIECHWDEGDTNGQEAMTIGASITLNLYGEGNAGGNDKMTGTATVEEITGQWQRNGVVSRTFRIKGNGALSHTTV